MKNVLFVTWDGSQTNYLTGLFLPIFTELKKYGYNFSVVQFSWAENETVKNISESCNKQNVNYRHVKVIRKPNVSIGSLLTATLGSRIISKVINEWSIDILMPRSILPAYITHLVLNRYPDIKYAYDADGLPLDERVDFSAVKATSLIHRFMRDTEMQAIVRSTLVLTRSEVSQHILQHRAGSGTSIDKFHVVKNGRMANDFKVFDSTSRTGIRSKINVCDSSPLIVYAGSLGPQYCVSQMLHFYCEVKNKLPDTKLLILSGDHSFIQFEINRIGLDMNSIIFKTLSSEEVGEYLSASDVGLAIREQSFSMQGVAPIKLGEYFMCGLPVVATHGIGDTELINHEIGFVLPNNRFDQIDLAVDWFIDKFKNSECTREQSSAFGFKHFSLSASVKSYQKALDTIS